MSKRGRLVCLAGYLALIICVVGGMFEVRRRTLETLGTPQAIAEWQAWREAAAEQSAQGPVRRRVPKSEVPPALVLMRGYFPALLCGSLFFSSVFYVLFVWGIRGAIATKPLGPKRANEKTDSVIG